MTDSREAALAEGIATLWASIPGPREDAERSPAFADFVSRCRLLYLDESDQDAMRRGNLVIDGLPRALSNAFRYTGAPWLGTPPLTQFVPSPLSVAQRLHAAFLQTEASIVHLCPLDTFLKSITSQAHPLVRFNRGCSEIRRFDRTEFDNVVGAARLFRYNPVWVFNSGDFQEFTWLVVREARPLVSLNKRIYQLFGTPVDSVGSPLDDWPVSEFEWSGSKIQPHPRRFPECVEHALFTLLLVPWEEWRSDYWGWRGFRVPWIYSVIDYPFAHPLPPRDPRELTWTVRVLDDGDAMEEPCDVDLEDIDAQQLEREITGADEAAKAISCRGASWLTAHFLFSAFMEKGIDEFIFHILAIEASAALCGDYTKDTVKRVSKLTKDKSVEKRLPALYKRRSAYLHGRELEDLTVDEMRTARALARTVAKSVLLQAAANPSQDRDTLLRNIHPPGKAPKTCTKKLN